MNNSNPWTYEKFCAFTEGEGCFTACVPPDKVHYIYTRLKIQLRDDDSYALRQLQQFLKIGKITHHIQHNDNTNHKSTTTFTVGSQPQCLQLVRIFDNYTFCTKKQNDYRLWREIVIHVNRKSHLNGSYRYLCALCDRLKEVRQYDHSQIQVIFPPPTHHQTTLFPKGLTHHEP